MKTITTIGIIGHGRFGSLMAQQLCGDFSVMVYDHDSAKLSSLPKSVTSGSLENICQADLVIVAVPIHATEKVMLDIATLLKPTSVVMDVLSVKVFPVETMKKVLVPKHILCVTAHPMFGPDSFDKQAQQLPVMMHAVNATKEVFVAVQLLWENYFHASVQIMTPEEHDRLAAYSQGITHMIGRVLDEMGVSPTAIDTKGFKALLEVREQTCHDTWDLFRDLQQYNDVTKEMRESLRKALNRVDAALMPPKPEKLIIGIQGGKGSFNEEAAHAFCTEKGFTDYELQYLYTSERVMEALAAGTISYGQCAVHNAIGGIVDETVDALATHICHVKYDIMFEVNHCLLVAPGTALEDITTIMSHPQALAQCKHTLAESYSDKTLASGEGDRIDQSLLAKDLGEGVLDKNIAVLAPKICAELYNLDVLAEGLQDMERNITTFLWFEK